MSMWKFILMAVTCVFMFSCEDTDPQGNPINLWVEGKIEGAARMKLYLEAPSEKGMITVFSGTVEEDGSIKMKGNIAGLGFYQLRLGEEKQNAIPITPMVEDKIILNTSLKEFNVQPNLKGPIWTKTLNSYMKQIAFFRQEQMKLMARRAELTEQVFANQLLILKKPLLEFVKKEIDKNPSNPFHIVLSMELFPMIGFEGWDPKNLDYFKKVSDGFSSSYGNCPASEALDAQYGQLEAGYNQFAQIEGGVLQAPNFALLDRYGKTVKLSDFKGKLVLIDFWASWCGPCRQESPNMVKLYKKYRSKDFTILSVSMDDDPVKWKEAIKADGLIWETHVSDLRGWESGMIKLYQFDGIPYTVLVNPEGKIIGQGLRGVALEEKIASFYNQSL